MKNMFAALLLLAAAPAAQAAITSTAWGGVDKQGVDLFTLTNKSGMEVKITNYGGTITSIRVPGQGGQVTNVVQGFDSLDDYAGPGHGGRYGAIIGRFANRIKNNSFAIDGVSYKIGRDGYNYADFNKPYDERVWTATRHDGDEPRLELTLVDRKGTMGFPGTLHVTVTYTLTRGNALRITYHAVTDADTVIALTNHAYFNMAGDVSGSVLDQLLTVNGDFITAGDESNTPTGEKLVICPADGKLLPIVEAAPPAELGMGDAPRVRLSIFMNVFNVHVNRNPVSGQVTALSYRPGKFFNASFDKASIDNERMSVRVKADTGQELAYVQIAGLVARRIVCELNQGQSVVRGQRFGIIRFGSRVDVYLPPGCEILVTAGMKTTAGETVLARLV